MMDQLIEGHQWLKKHLDYHPKNGYNCDTFGATPTTAYLNQLAGIDHMLIQRTHYIVKKQFAKKQMLEFTHAPPNICDVFVKVLHKIKHEQSRS